MSMEKSVTRRGFLAGTTTGVVGLSAAASGVSSPPIADGDENLLKYPKAQPLADRCRPWAPHDTLQPHCRMFDAGDEKVFEIESNGSIGCHGGWELRCEVESGATYRFAGRASLASVPRPSENVSPEIYFFNESDKRLHWDFVAAERIEDGEIVFSKYVKAPEGASHALIRLLLRWTPHGTVRFRSLRLQRAISPISESYKIGVGAGIGKQGSIEKNVVECLKIVEEAARNGAQLALLPELITTWGLPGDPWKNARPIPGAETSAFSECARSNQIAIALSMLEANAELVHNTGLLFEPDGSISLKYRKLQLAVGERWSGITPGDDLPVAKTRLGRIGMQICYDNTHPETLRTLSYRGAEVVLMPIMGDPRTRLKDEEFSVEKWRLIMRSRALDNHVWLVVARNKGPHSCIVNPAGDIVTSMGEGERLIYADIDLGYRNWSWIGSNFLDRYWHERRPSAFESLSSTNFRTV